MTRRFGIDTSVLVRLLTGEPEADFALCAAATLVTSPRPCWPNPTQWVKRTVSPMPASGAADGR